MWCNVYRSDRIASNQTLREPNPKSKFIPEIALVHGIFAAALFDELVWVQAAFLGLTTSQTDQ
jgi:hypothetical protein